VAPLPSTPAQARAYLPKTIASARGCGRLSGALLDHVSTTDDARDLDYLRQLVGDRQLSYWALSYGAFLGETYANMFPRRVRAMVLDGVVDPRVVISGAAARFANTIAAMDSGLGAFEALCQRAGPSRCALAGRGPVARRVAGLLFASLASPAAWPQLAVDLRQAINGGGSALVTQARAVLAGTRSAAADSQTAIICADSPARQGPDAWPHLIARLTHISAWAGPFAGWTNWAPCASWPARSAERYTGPWNRPTKIPLLLIGTTADPGTPYVNARRVASLLGNAVLLTHDGYGHTSEADPSRCVEHATSAYLVRLAIPRKRTVCQSDRQPFGPG
jgi:pimeloyl-ACP methyl ester carboxylesterase